MAASGAGRPYNCATPAITSSGWATGRKIQAMMQYSASLSRGGAPRSPANCPFASRRPRWIWRTLSYRYEWVDDLQPVDLPVAAEILGVECVDSRFEAGGHEQRVPRRQTVALHQAGRPIEHFPIWQRRLPQVPQIVDILACILRSISLRCELSRSRDILARDLPDEHTLFKHIHKFPFCP